MSSNAFAGPWSSLPTPLTPWILDTLASMNHTRMTPVQAATIPLFMGNKDVVVEAVTGSGKTLAFIIPILERLSRRSTPLRSEEPGAIIISPTRELAQQIHSVFSTFLSSQPEEEEESSSKSHLAPALLCTSSLTAAQLAEPYSVIVGTPGHLSTLLASSKGPSTRELDVLVLDEADRLLDLGFAPTLSKIMHLLPKQRRTGLFSATMTDAEQLAELVKAGLRNPARVVVRVNAKRKAGETERVEERRIPAGLTNNFILTPTSSKLIQLSRIIQHEASLGATRMIVYFSTCAAVDYFYAILPTIIPNAVLHSLHGHMPPAARARALSAFAASPLSTGASSSSHVKPHVLLATDLAARGLDLPHVNSVIQFDAPTDPRAFTHRIGRTARAGEKGSAWVLLSGREEQYVDFLKVRKVPLQRRGAFNAELLESPVANSNPEDDNADEEEDPQVSLNLDKIRALLLKDRALHDKAARAFVANMRAYGAHEASFIFRPQNLDLAGLAKAFGLLRMPRMPEWNSRSEAERAKWTDADADWDKHAYADPKQEQKRLKEIAKREGKREEGRKAAAKRKERKITNESWSKEVGRKDVKEKRKEKKKAKRKWEKSQTQPPYEEGKGARGEEEDVHDWQEMMEEQRQTKRIRGAHAVPVGVEGIFSDL